MPEDDGLDASPPENTAPQDPLHPATEPPEQTPGGQKIVSFRELAGEGNVVIVDFQGQHYFLRLTKAGRLLLTK